MKKAQGMLDMTIKPINTYLLMMTAQIVNSSQRKLVRFPIFEIMVILH